MKLEITQTVEVPISPYCKNCLRREVDNAGQTFCTIYNQNLFAVNGQLLKCEKCYKALYKQLYKNAK